MPKLCLNCTRCYRQRAGGLCKTCFHDDAVRERFPPIGYQKPAPPGEKPCRHCNYGKVNRPRGLCFHCYYRSGFRENYMSDSPCARRSPIPANAKGRLPEFPTTAPPGTPEKLAVMEERAKRGECLFHPDDARWDGGGLQPTHTKLREAA